MTIVVIDADQMVYSCGFATEGEPISHTFHTVNHAIQKVMAGTKADEYQVYIGGEGNFREDIATTLGYKAHRTARKPAAFNEIRQYLLDNHKAIVVNGMEVDDMVSLLLYQDYLETEGDPTRAQVILSSPDKDLKNTPGWHFNPMRGSLSWINETQAMRHFLFQMLTGDSTDNIKGLPNLPSSYIFSHKLSPQAKKGVGKGTAKKLLESTITIEEALDVVLDAYMAWGVDRGMSYERIMEYILEQGILLWMVREVDENLNPKIFEFTEEWHERAKRAYEGHRYDQEAGRSEAGGPELHDGASPSARGAHSGMHGEGTSFDCDNLDRGGRPLPTDEPSSPDELYVSGDGPADAPTEPNGDS